MCELLVGVLLDTNDVVVMTENWMVLMSLLCLLCLRPVLSRVREQVGSDS
jgi:hypothetical protein